MPSYEGVVAARASAPVLGQLRAGLLPQYNDLRPEVFFAEQRTEHGKGPTFQRCPT